MQCRLQLEKDGKKWIQALRSFVAVKVVLIAFTVFTY